MALEALLAGLFFFSFFFRIVNDRFIVNDSGIVSEIYGDNASVNISGNSVCWLV